MKYGKMFEYEEFLGEHNNLLRIENMDYDTRFYKIPIIYKKAVDLLFNDHDLMYTDIGGNSDFKVVISDYERTLTNINKVEKTIFVANGVSSLICPIIESILMLPENKKRKEVIVFSPEYPLFHSSIEAANGKPIIVKGKREKDFLPEIDDIENSFNTRTAAIIFSNLNNPTGKSFSYEWLDGLVEISKKKNIFIISDEIYSQMLFKKKSYVNLSSLIGGYDNYIKIFGLSKDRPGMTGIRAGYCIGDKRLLQNIKNISMVRSFSNNVLGEYIFFIDIALRYFKISNIKTSELDYFDEEDIEDYYNTISKNENYIQQNIEISLSELEKNNNVVDIINPDGGNTIFFKYYKSLSPTKLVKEFIQKGLGIYPGDVFGINNTTDGSWIRLCVTKSTDKLKEMIRKI